MPKDRPVPTAIIGAGNMGGTYARLIREGAVPGLHLAAVCDSDASRLEAFDGVPVFDSPEALIASQSCEAVVIATPHFSHPPIGIAALHAGLHVLVDKPIGVHVADARRLVKAHDGSRVFAAMFNQRTDPRYLRLKAMVSSGELGPIQRIQWTITDWFRTQAYYDSGGWRATWAGEGGGVLLNQCPHQLDLWQWLFGMPDRVRGMCTYGRFHSIEVEDDVTAILQYASGTRGVFVTTTGEAPGVNRLEVAAGNGLVIVEGNTLTFRRNAQPAGEFIRTCPHGFAAPPTEVLCEQFDNNGPQHAGILCNFAQAILNGAALIAPAAEGLGSVELANAILYSSHLGTELGLPLDEGAYEEFLSTMIAQSNR